MLYTVSILQLQVDANVTQIPLYKSHSGYSQLTRIASIYILHVSLIYGFTMAMVMSCLGNMWFVCFNVLPWCTFLAKKKKYVYVLT